MAFRRIFLIPRAESQAPSLRRLLSGSKGGRPRRKPLMVMLGTTGTFIIPGCMICSTRVLIQAKKLQGRSAPSLSTTYTIKRRIQLMKSRFLSFLIIIAMLLGMVPNVGMVTAYGVPAPSQTIDVRVEGPDGKMYETSVSVTDETNGLELLESAIGAENVLGYTSGYGYFLTGIVDGEGTSISGLAGEEWSTSWGVYEKRGGEIDSSATGLDGVSLGGLEELLVHYKAYDSITYADLTFIPRVSARQSGLELTITVNKEVASYDENWNLVTSEEPMAGAVVKIGDTEYTTDENGVVTPDLAFGSYEAFVYKEGDNYPQLVRSSFDFEYANPWNGDSIDVRVEGPDGKMYETSVSVTDETNGLELLVSAIGEANVIGYTSGYGYFLTGIVDGEGTSISGLAGEEWSTSWGVYEK